MTQPTPADQRQELPDYSESVVRLRAWIRDFGHDKQPQFIADLEEVLAKAQPASEELRAENERLRVEHENVMDLLRRSFMEHGDCKSGERYGGLPKACTACMAQLKLRELSQQWKGRQVRLS